MTHPRAARAAVKVQQMLSDGLICPQPPQLMGSRGPDLHYEVTVEHNDRGLEALVLVSLIDLPFCLGSARSKARPGGGLLVRKRTLLTLLPPTADSLAEFPGRSADRANS
jgi:hypothetical protein